MRRETFSARKRDEPAAGLNARRSPARPCLILIMGVAGSGKTTLAKNLLRRLRAVYLDNNHIVDPFFPHTRSGASYERLRPRFYQALYAIVEANLKLGNSVVLDVPHVKEMQSCQWRASMQNLARRSRAKLLVIRCFCSEETLRIRLCSRGEKRDQQKLAHWAEFVVEQPIQLSVPLRHLEIDTESDPKANVRAAVRYIMKSSQTEN